jgi:hypothetical protein
MLQGNINSASWSVIAAELILLSVSLSYKRITIRQLPHAIYQSS